MQLYRLLLILLLLMSSCGISKTPGFYSGYKTLSETQKSEIVFLDSSINLANCKKGNKLNAVSGKQLNNLIASHDTSLIYVWSPHCSSNLCLSLNSVYNYCAKKGYKLYIVLEYYSDFEFAKLQFSPQYNIYSINHFDYKTEYCPKYSNRFVKDLLNGAKIPKSESYHRYYIFYSNKFVKSLASLQ